MIKRKILIVSKFFYPENSPRSFRATELAKELARQGHKVTVITPRISDIHDKFEIEHKISIRNLGKPRWNNLKLKGTGIERLIRRALVRFPKLLFEFPDIQLIGLIKKALSYEQSYDLLISIAVPHPIHWGVAAVRSGKHPIAKVWVADCGDPYMGQENDSFKVPFYFKYVEKWFCRKADYLSVPTPGAIEGYYPEFRNKIKVIPQGFRFEDIKVKKSLYGRPYPEFAYAGMFIPGRRDPTELLSYLISLTKDFRFHIYTKTPALAKPFTDKSKGRVIIHQPIAREELLYELSGMDFMVNFENIGTKQTPSKLIDYAIIDKPILSVRTGELNTKVVDEFLVKKYQNRYQMIRDSYQIHKVTSKFLALLKN